MIQVTAVSRSYSDCSVPRGVTAR